MLAITDHDEARLYVRRGLPGDTQRAHALLDAARRQFKNIGMTGWVSRADALQSRLGSAGIGP